MDNFRDFHTTEVFSSRMCSHRNKDNFQVKITGTTESLDPLISKCSIPGDIERTGTRLSQLLRLGGGERNFEDAMISTPKTKEGKMISTPKTKEEKFRP